MILLNVLNLKREEVLQKSAQDISLRNDLLRRLIRELMDSQKKTKLAKRVFKNICRQQGKLFSDEIYAN